MKLLFTGFIYFVCTIDCWGQNRDTIYEGYHLDESVVTARLFGFDIDAFIRMVRNDKTFYQAFKNLRKAKYEFDPEIKLYDKKSTIKASYQSKAQQYYDSPCRTMGEKEIEAKGNFIEKSGEWHYYTAKMYQRLFMTNGKVCEDGNENKSPNTKMEKYVHELKNLIFNPGEESSIPFIGNKTAIFSSKMKEYYQYSISKRKYKGDRDCYIFSIVVKPQYKHGNDVVIQFMETYFDAQDFQVLGRIYELYSDNLFYSFDVHMDIQLQKLNNFYYPEKIRYEGSWDIPLKKPEICTFSTSFYNFIK